MLVIFRKIICFIYIWLTAILQKLFHMYKKQQPIHVFLFFAMSVLMLVYIIMRPSSLGGGRIMRRTLSVCLSVRPSVPLLFLFTFFTVEPSYERTSKIEKLLFSLMGQARPLMAKYVLFGTHRGPHIVRPSRPHKLVLIPVPTRYSLVQYLKMLQRLEHNTRLYLPF